MVITSVSNAAATAVRATPPSRPSAYPTSPAVPEEESKINSPTISGNGLSSMPTAKDSVSPHTSITGLIFAPSDRRRVAAPGPEGV